MTVETVPEKESVPILEHNKEIAIATAGHRAASRWKNTSTTIAEFVARLKRTVRTSEKFADYVRMPKGDQDNIKDVGAFVGGTLKGGRRRKEDVANRHIITLDMDYADSSIVDRIKDVLSGYCWSVYSTHKHSPKRPRLRLIVYPDRPLMPDEYQAVARKVAAKVSIDAMDDTTYDLNRLFYWPSTSHDAEFVHLHNDAPFLPVDAILAEYGPDDLWRDVTLWPTSSREGAHVTRLLKRQADPLTKKSIVGAWCRAFSIHQAMDDLLADVYQKEKDGRYSYIEGSTANGVVIYDGKFCYSNHATDPAHGQTCNAWDIVRIHKFGHLDADAKDGTPGNKLPSYRAMHEYADSFPAVKSDLVKSGLAVSIADFESFGKGAEGEDWMPELQTTADGKTIKSCWHNYRVILEKDVRLKDLMRLNLFTEREERADGKLWTDHDTSEIKAYLGARYLLDPPGQKIEEVISYQAERNAFHPVREYLEGLRWDGIERVETIFIDYLGAEDNHYTRQAALCWFSAAVHRIFHPGHKFDSVPVLGGVQGVMKTTFVRTLGLGRWCGDLTSFDPKVAMEEINGKWIIEMAELSATTKQELEQQKSFLSAQSTTVRMAYARRSKEFFRQCVFMGTTNSKEYLKDSTGNRRWWPIDIKVEKKINIAKLEKEIDQIWAEAYASLYAVGYRTYLDDEAEELAKQAQEEKRFSDEWQGIIQEWLEMDADKDRYDLASFGAGGKELRDRACVIEIWEDALKMGATSKPKPHDRNRIAIIMDNTPGWDRVSTMRFGEKYGRQKGWRRETPF